MLNQSDLKHRQVVLLTNQELRHLCISQGNIVIKDENNEVLTRISKNKVLAIMSVGHITLTSVLLDYCQKHNIALILMNERLRPILFMSHSADANFLLRQKQYLMANELKLYFASRIIQNKINSHIALLKNIRNKSDDIKQAIVNLELYQEQCLIVNDLNHLMGIEGNSAKLFFKIHFG